MKSQKPMRALLAASVLLVGINSVEGALCSASVFGQVALATCDCPAGSGPSGSYGVALPSKPDLGYAHANKAAASAADEEDAAQAALKLCVDLLPGYKMTAGGTSKLTPIPCDTADNYCPGLIDAFIVATNSITTTCATGDGSCITPLMTSNYAHATGAGAAVKTQSSSPIACPGDSVSTAGDTFITLEKCIVPNGKYLNKKPDATAGTTATCPLRSVCATGQNAVAVYTPVDCHTQVNSAGIAVNADNTPGGFLCPAGTYGSFGETLALTIAGIVGETVCGAGSAPVAAGGALGTCAVLPGYFGAASTTGTAMTACPDKITGNAAQATLKDACVKVMPGYDILTAIPAQTGVGTLDALVAGITPCAGPNKYCPGGGTIAITGTSAAQATYTLVAKLADATLGATKCPTGVGNALTGETAQGANAKSLTTGCIDLLPGYAFKASVGATVVIADLIGVCAVAAPGKYRCAGSAGVFSKYTTAAEKKTALDNFGLTITDSMLIAADNALVTGDTVATAAAGGLIVAACPGNSLSASNGDGIGTCKTNPGYYVDHSNLLVPTECAANKYCPGGYSLGVAGGLLNCPTGSSAPTTSSKVNSNINACTLKEGFYLATGASSTPVPCLAANICAGGGPVGTAGGSVACPTGSLNAACTSSADATTVNLTPASQPITTTTNVAAPNAAAAPDVTVTNTVPSASSAASTVASMVVVTVAAMVAL